jgi:hypothetical protein
MRKWTLLFVVALTFALGTSLAFPPTAKKSTRNRLGVDTLTPAGMPVSLNGATATFADGRGLSELTYIVTNKSKSIVRKIKLVAFVMDQGGNIRGGESWIEALDLRPDTSLEKKGVLKNAAWAGYRVVLILEYAKAANELWRISLTQEFEAARTYLRTGHNALSDAQYERGGVRPLDALPESDPGGDVCSQRLAQANMACPNGLASFSCDPNTGVFSFTCK